MKKSVIYLGIALVTFTNVISALGQQSHDKESLMQIVQSNENLDGNVHGNDAVETNSSKDGNPAGLAPETIELPTYKKTTEEIIAENNLIIENSISSEEITNENTADDYMENLSTDFYPLNNEKTTEEIILQDMQITESPSIIYIQPATLKKSKKQ